MVAPFPRITADEYEVGLDERCGNARAVDKPVEPVILANIRADRVQTIDAFGFGNRVNQL
jgi:hypothetical protein